MTATGTSRGTKSGAQRKPASRPGTGQRTTPRPPARPNLPAAAGEGAIQPLLLSSAAPEDEIVYDTHVFSIDDTDYFMPSDPPMNWGVEYLGGMGSGNEVLAAEAAVTMYKRMLTEEGWAALAGYKQLKKSQFRQVIEGVVKTLMGPLELPKDAPTE